MNKIIYVCQFPFLLLWLTYQEKVIDKPSFFVFCGDLYFSVHTVLSIKKGICTSLSARTAWTEKYSSPQKARGDSLPLLDTEITTADKSVKRKPNNEDDFTCFLSTHDDYTKLGMVIWHPS